jgi:hypothetical protein
MKPTPQQLKNRATWLAALRSGDYQQTTLGLHKPGQGYCCLGVAAECAGVDRFEEYDPLVGFISFFTFDGSPESQEPPAHWFSEWYGVAKPLAKSIIDNAIMINDEGGWSFADIADMLNAWFLEADAACGSTST